ncbi:MAG: hypothetical protein N3B18_11145 [Desulfobacterota bacterium]|nr:hypothetical protein [Thermodesulfobacteriota bacterium]
MSASYKNEPHADDEELEALFKKFDTQLREVQQKFSKIEKDIADIRKKQEAPDDQDPLDGVSQTPNTNESGH